MHTFFDILKKIWAAAKHHIPEILIASSALTIVILAPLPIWDDGTQFEKLSRSILNREYSLTPGVPSMYREPGYPFFRALIYALGGSPETVLIVQALLAACTCLMWRRIWEHIKPGYGWIGAWGTFFAYGYWLFSRQHAYETLLGFLLAGSMHFTYAFLKEQRIQHIAASGLLLGCLTATRGVFIFLWIPMTFFIAAILWPKIQTALQRKTLFINLALFIVCANAIPGVWILRNAVQLHSYGIASRPGLVLLARGIKTEASWKDYYSSLVGSFTGDALLKKVLPSLTPITYQHYTILDAERERIATELKLPSTDSQVDAVMMKEATKDIFRSPTSISKYIAWTLVDEIRLVSLPSFTTPWGTMEPMFLQQAQLSMVHILFLLIADLLNLLWIFGGISGCIIGIIRYRGKFLIAIPYVYLLCIHAPLDNVVRFSATIQPIIGTFVVFAVLLALHALRLRLFVSTNTIQRKSAK